jgi:hypothetical protein
MYLCIYATRHVNVSVTTINNCLSGIYLSILSLSINLSIYLLDKTDTAGGYKWNYIEGPKKLAKVASISASISDRSKTIEGDIEGDKIEETDGKLYIYVSICLCIYVSMYLCSYLVSLSIYSCYILFI